MLNKKKAGLFQKRNRYGYLFSAHWILGLLLFFIVPTITSIVYAFSQVRFGEEGLMTEFIKFENFRYILQDDAHYVNDLRDSVIHMLISLPIIIALSLFLALILNSEFKGRLLFRAIFFLPVIIANPVVMNILTDDLVGASLFTVTSGAQYSYGGLIDFNQILSQLNLPEAITNLFAEYLQNVFNLIWSSGVQTILFLAGLQSIPKQLYEVGKIEGASRWETFWFMELPMLRNVLMLVLIYTMIELFTALDSPVMKLISSAMFESQIYDRSAAMLWGYFLVAGAIMAIILFAYNRICIRRWE